MRRRTYTPIRQPPLKQLAMITPEEYAKAGTEHAHQVALFMWVQQTGQYQYPLLKRLFAIPNGGLRHPVTSNRLKAEGVKAGVSDLFLPVPVWTTDALRSSRIAFCGCFIEMKKPGATTTVEQDEFITFARSVGFYCAVCHGWEVARDVLLEYISGRLSKY
jgi:hypothetical protein